MRQTSSVERCLPASLLVLVLAVGAGCDGPSPPGDRHREHPHHHHHAHQADHHHTHDLAETDQALRVLRNCAALTPGPLALERICVELSSVSTDTLVGLVDHDASTAQQLIGPKWDLTQLVVGVTEYRRLPAETRERALIADLLASTSERDHADAFRRIGAQPDLELVERLAISYSRARRPEWRAAAGRLAGIVCAFGGAGDAMDRVLANLIADRDPRVAYVTAAKVAFGTRRAAVFDALFRATDDPRELPHTGLFWFSQDRVGGMRVGDRIRQVALGHMEETASRDWLRDQPIEGRTRTEVRTWWRAARDTFPFDPAAQPQWVEDLDVVRPGVHVGVEDVLRVEDAVLTVLSCEEGWKENTPVTSAALNLAYGTGQSAFSSELEYRGADDAWTGRTTLSAGSGSGARLVHFRVQRLLDGTCRLRVSVWRRP